MKDNHSKVKPKGREAVKGWHRQKVISAAIDTIADYGIPGTTISRVVERAALSRGMVNLHFNNKETLLFEALKYICEQYAHSLNAQVNHSGSGPVEEVLAILRADLSKDMLTQKMTSVWFAYRAQTNTHKKYLPYIETRTEEFSTRLSELIKEIIQLGGYHDIHAETVARGLTAMAEGMWVDYHLHSKDFDRERAFETYLTFLVALFPEHFNKPM